MCACLLYLFSPVFGRNSPKKLWYLKMDRARKTHLRFPGPIESCYGCLLELVIQADAQAVIGVPIVILVVFITDVKRKIFTKLIVCACLPFRSVVVGNYGSVAIEPWCQIGSNTYTVEHFIRFVSIVVIPVAEDEPDIGIQLILSVDIGGFPIVIEVIRVVVAFKADNELVGHGAFRVEAVVVGAVTHAVVRVSHCCLSGSQVVKRCGKADACG
ncbi:MAG: hypothetical protein H6Q75_1776 [Firmicutes bacterium]|nr:hypothetical protein [Bacillota bacterium]